MTEAEEIVEALLELDEHVGLTESARVLPVSRGVFSLHEEDDEETIKDILGVDYLEEPEDAAPVPGEVERFDRWADIKIGDKNFCVSYLTPVAVYIPGQGAMLTDRDWSPTTKRHIVKWMNHIGLGPAEGYRKYAEVAARFPEVPQQELIDLFKRESKRVRWTKRQVRKAEKLPYRKMPFVKGGTQDRISMDAHTERK